MRAGTRVAKGGAVPPLAARVDSARAPSRVRAVCRHCGARLGDETPGDFCCTGCASVHALLGREGLGRYYDLRSGGGFPVPSDGRARDHAWLEAMERARAASSTSPGLSRVELDVQGLHCSACVWLMGELFRREGGAVGITVNPALGRMSLAVEPSFPLRRFVEHVEAFGYAVGPRARDDRSLARGLLTRLGVSAALSMNAMIFAIAVYAGLATGTLHRLFETLDLGLATGVVVVGGTVFFRAAWQGVRRRALHLDLPIALGIAASYLGSVHAWATGGQPYFDTVCVFVTLMLAGRFLRQRVLEKNRRMLLEGADASGLLTRRLGEDGTPELVPCTRVREGERLWIGPGDLVPVDGRVEGEASCSLDWVSGESAPRRYEAGSAVPAGAFNAGSCPLVVRADGDFEASSLVDILRTPVRGVDDARGQAPLWQRFASVYVVGVLAVALGGFAGWLHFSHDLHRAIGVATAVLVVTCPCAFGIATPLGYEIVQSRLRLHGLFVRAGGFLDRAARVTRVAFDKTGTLTTGALGLQNASILDGLAAADLAVLTGLAAATSHPV